VADAANGIRFQAPGRRPRWHLHFEFKNAKDQLLGRLSLTPNLNKFKANLKELQGAAQSAAEFKDVSLAVPKDTDKNVIKPYLMGLVKVMKQ